jgi:hypothetical protein
MKNLEFEGIKLRKTDFCFKNKRIMNDFFNDALIESPIKFKNLMNQMAEEEIHVFFSRYLVFKIIGFGLMASAFIGTFAFSHSFGMILGGISFFFIIWSFFSHRTAKRLTVALEFSEEIFNIENGKYMEEIRKELIKAKKTGKKNSAKTNLFSRI